MIPSLRVRHVARADRWVIWSQKFEFAAALGAGVIVGKFADRRFCSRPYIPPTDSGWNAGSGTCHVQRALLAPLACSEGVYWASDSVAPAVGLRRVHRVVVSRPWLQVVHAHAEHRIGMGRVQPDVRSRGLAQVLGIRAVVNNSKVLRRAARVVGGPPDNGQIFCG